MSDRPHIQRNILAGEESIAIIPWFNHIDDYEACHRVMRDRGVKVIGYDRWRAKVEKFERSLDEIRHPYMRVVINPEHLANWCIERGYHVDDSDIYEFAHSIALSAGLHEKSNTLDR